jgi:hypothetical protein
MLPLCVRAFEKGVKIFLFLYVETPPPIRQPSSIDAGRKIAFHPPEGRITTDTSPDLPARAERCRSIVIAAEH